MKKIVRKVISRKKSGGSLVEELSIRSTDELLAEEIDKLKEQVVHLKRAVESLQEDSNKKQAAVHQLAREKEKLTYDLLKEKRINSKLIQQLDEERRFYYAEKQTYCKEMKEFKKYKQGLIAPNSEAHGECKKEILTVRESLNQTLIANYNLSIKFLRMKNTKDSLKAELKSVKLHYNKMINELKIKVEALRFEVNNIIKEKFKTALSPSSKKYLELVGQNSCLVYENLSLQIEVDRLNDKLQNVKFKENKSKVNSELRFFKSVESCQANEVDSSQTLGGSRKTNLSQDRNKQILNSHLFSNCKLRKVFSVPNLRL